jgi:hypothetical protein
MVIGNVVIPAKETRRLLQLGIKPSKRLQGGGSFAFDPQTLAQITGGETALTQFQASQLTQQTVSQAQAAGGGGAIAITAAAVETATQTAVESVVAETVPAIAAALPTSQEIANAVAAPTAKQLAAQIRSNEKMSGLLEELVVLTEDQGTADDIGLSVRDGLAGIQG